MSAGEGALGVEHFVADRLRAEVRAGRMPPCPRCGAPVALVVRHPYAWRNASGVRLTGHRESVLCRHCDAPDPAAHTLLALLTDTPDLPHRETLTTLAHHWATTRTLDAGALATEEALWRSGKL